MSRPRSKSVFRNGLGHLNCLNEAVSCLMLSLKIQSLSTIYCGWIHSVVFGLLALSMTFLAKRNNVPALFQI